MIAQVKLHHGGLVVRFVLSFNILVSVTFTDLQ